MSTDFRNSIGAVDNVMPLQEIEKLLRWRKHIITKTES